MNDFGTSRNPAVESDTEWFIMLPNPPEGPEVPAEGFGPYGNIMEAHTAAAAAMRENKLPRGSWIKGVACPDGTETGKDR